MKGRIPKPIPVDHPLLELTASLEMEMEEYLTLYNEYILARKRVNGLRSISRTNVEMNTLSNKYAAMLEKKAEVNTTWVELKKTMSKSKQSRLL